jgi:4-diphosphocytidyl-2C-methyl-D-erythritol kinase
VPTAEAYAWVAADRGARPPTVRVLTPERLGDWKGVAALAENDFEVPVARRVPGVARLAEARPLFEPPLPPGVVPPVYRMSGSGSTWFVLVADDRLRLDVGDGEAWRTVWTETAVRVAPVERIG